MFKTLDEGRPRRLVIDVRKSIGGDHYELPLLLGIIQRPWLNTPDSLFLITGRWTFSAGMHLVNQMTRHTNVTTFGEPTGARPNFFGAQKTFRAARLLQTYDQGGLEELKRVYGEWLPSATKHGLNLESLLYRSLDPWVSSHAASPSDQVSFLRFLLAEPPESAEVTLDLASRPDRLEQKEERRRLCERRLVINPAHPSGRTKLALMTLDEQEAAKTGNPGEARRRARPDGRPATRGGSCP